MSKLDNYIKTDRVLIVSRNIPGVLIKALILRRDETKTEITFRPNIVIMTEASWVLLTHDKQNINQGSCASGCRNVN
jgi:hypothetical protein